MDCPYDTLPILAAPKTLSAYGYVMSGKITERLDFITFKTALIPILAFFILDYTKLPMGSSYRNHNTLLCTHTQILP